jgi:hypothetical protein
MVKFARGSKLSKLIFFAISMENNFREIIEDIFNRWTALKLAVEHGMAKNGVQVRD